MKKKIVVLLSLVLVMSSLLCACGGEKTTVKLLNEETQEYEETSVSIVGNWKGVPSGKNVVSFNKNGTCTIGEGEYKYEVEDNNISVKTFGFFTIKKDGKYVILAFDSAYGDRVYVREDEYEEYCEYFADK